MSYCYIWNKCVAYILSLRSVQDSNLLQDFQALVHSQSISQCRGSRIFNFISFKTVKESICTPELMQVMNGITRNMLNHPEWSLSKYLECPQTCSYSSSWTTMATWAMAKLHSQTKGNPCYVWRVVPGVYLKPVYILLSDCHSQPALLRDRQTHTIKHMHVLLIFCLLGLYGIVTYFSTFKLWFTLRASASAEAPDSPILFSSRLWKRVHVLQN